MRELLGAEISAAQGALSLRQAHLHAHSHATRVSLHRVRAGRVETLYRMDHYCGEGECQHFVDLPGAPDLRLGDALEVRCLYRNPRPIPLVYGLSTGMEMCGPIIVFTPHTAAVKERYPPMWYDGDRGTQRHVDADGNATSAPTVVRHPPSYRFYDFPHGQR